MSSDDDDDSKEDSLEDLFKDDSDEEESAPQAEGPAHGDADEDDDLSVRDLLSERAQQGAGGAVPEDPDGHVNAEGVNYRQPRSPFAGTRWVPIKNAFVRIDVDNRSAPKGTKPQGYVFNKALNGFRRTLAQTNYDEERFTEQDRNAEQPRRAGSTQEMFGPEVSNATLLEISWYVSACGHHVPYAWFNLVANAWRTAVDKTGDRGQLMMAYERGERKEYGHLQGISRVLTHESMKEKLRRWLRAALLLSSGMYRAKIGLVFFTGQEWDYMGGYVQKDMGKAHYRFLAYPEIDAGAFVYVTHAHRIYSFVC